MNQQIEKLLAMLDMETIRIRENRDLAEIDSVYLEIQRFIKTEYAKLEELRELLFLEALDGREEGEIAGYAVTYKPGSSFRLDSEKLKSYFASQNMNEEEMKMTIYSHLVSKPSLKLKNLKK